MAEKIQQDQTIAQAKDNAEAAIQKGKPTDFNTALAASKTVFKKVFGTAAQSVFNRELSYARLAVAKNPKLAECTPESVVIAISKLALSGMSLNPNLNQMYLVPRKNKDVMECNLDLGYQGMISVLVNSGSIISISPGIILQGEKYLIDDGLNKQFSHQPPINRILSAADEKKGIVAYTNTIFPGGYRDVHWMGKEEIYVHKGDAPGSKSPYSPWNGNYWWKMWVKTVIRSRVFPFVAKGNDMSYFLSILNQASGPFSKPGETQGQVEGAVVLE